MQNSNDGARDHIMVHYGPPAIQEQPLSICTAGGVAWQENIAILRDFFWAPQRLEVLHVENSTRLLRLEPVPGIIQQAVAVCPASNTAGRARGITG